MSLNIKNSLDIQGTFLMQNVDLVAKLNTMLSYLGSAGNNGMRKFRFEGEL